MMFEAIASLIEEKAEALASEWLAELERRGSALASAGNRRQLWEDAKTWITLLLRAMRTDDIAPLERASRLIAHRLAVAGFPAADAVKAVVAFKTVLWRATAELPDQDVEVVLSQVGRLSEWFDTIVVSMLGGYGSPDRGEESHSVVVDRAKHLSRLAEGESAVSHLAQEMASEHDPERLLELVARSAAHIAGAQKAAVVMREGDSLRYRGAYHLALTDLNSHLRRAHTPLTGPLTESESARIVTDFVDGAGDARARAAQKLDVHTALRVPMQVGEGEIALLELFDPIAAESWSDRDVDLVQDLAAQGALAVENARLLAATERRARDLTALNECGRALAAHASSPRLLPLAAKCAAQLLHAQSALLWLRPSGAARFQLKAAYGTDKRPRDLSLEPGQGPLAGAMSGGAAQLSLDARRTLSWQRGAAVAVPLRIGERALGLLAVHRRQGGFSDEDLRVFEALAGQVVVAVQNAELYEQSRALGERLNASIAALGEALAAALDMQELAQVVVDKGAELAAAAAAIIFLQDEGAQLAVRAVARRKGGVSPAADPKLYQHLAELTIERGEAVTLSARDQRSDAPLRITMGKEKIKAAHGFPLTVRGRVAGALCILMQGSALRPQERELLNSFSRQAAVGIENVILFGETQQRLAELADLSRASARVSSTLDQTAIVETIIESLSRALRVPVAAVVLIDAAGELRLPDGGQRGLPSSFVRRFAVRRDSIAFSVLADQRIKVISDTAAEGRGSDSLIEGLGLGSLICAPLKGRQGVLGVLFAADRLPRTFRPHEEALMSAYANEAALALQNAFHYQAVASHARELEGILDATKTLSSTLELQPVLDHLASAAASLLGAPICSIMLLDAGGKLLRTVAACGLPPEHRLHSDLHTGESIAGMVAMQGTRMSSTDLPRDGRFKHREVARSEGLLSMLSVPLSVKGKPVGVISAYSRAGQPFSSAQERLLTTLAAEASVAIENARLYAEAREQASSMRQLMEEVNHRIKNNLQSILGIIQLHMTQAQEPSVHEALRELTSRIQAIAVVHEVLFDEDMRAVDVKETSRRILDTALRADAHRGAKITGEVSGARVRLPSRKATPLASVVNELVYNSVTHAFPDREQGSVSINIQEATGGQILVQVRDDGVGLPAGFDLARDAKLGLRIVEGLVTRDLGGEFSIASNGGTIARVTFER